MEPIGYPDWLDSLKNPHVSVPLPHLGPSTGVTDVTLCSFYVDYGSL